jgi:hypothetical protein
MAFTKTKNFLKLLAVFLFFSVRPGLFTACSSGNRPIDCDFRAYDDREIRIKSVKDFEAKRKEIIHAIWNEDDLPSWDDVIVTCHYESPIHPSPFISTVHRIQVPVLERHALSEDTVPLRNLAWHFIPQEHNGRLAIFHMGHGCTIKADPEAGEYDNGVEALITTLLAERFEVLAVFMPHVTEDTCYLKHCEVMNTPVKDAPGSVLAGLRFFLEPVIVSLNYLTGMKDYEDISMIGLSGGGWTTTLVAALDQRIGYSCSVAGTMPVYYRRKGSIGDIEQYIPELYRDMAGYQDLYVLCSSGKERKHVQVLNRHDDCCFGVAQQEPERDYDADAMKIASDVSDALKTIGAESSFELKIDEKALNHQISSWTLNEVILKDLGTGH